jgi:hypothetical protein
MEAETRKHIMQVAKYLHIFSCELLKRASEHDASKLEEPEASIFEKMTPLLKGCTYGSDEYKKMLAEMKPALDHHYANNPHHPEFFDIWLSFQSDTNDRLSAMNLFDVVEMICDWLSATKRHDDGNINKSIAINKKRFMISDQLESILRNTANKLEEHEIMLDNRNQG